MKTTTVPAKLNFVQVIPNSQFYTDLKQIETSLQYGGDTIDKEYMLVAIRNTIKMGYKLVAPKKKTKKKKK